MSGAGETIYHIYGRKSYPQPLELVESVTLEDAGQLEMPAGDDWIEVIAFPESAVVRVIPRTKEEKAS